MAYQIHRKYSVAEFGVIIVGVVISRQTIAGCSEISAGRGFKRSVREKEEQGIEWLKNNKSDQQ